MSATLINGRALAQSTKDRLRHQIESFVEEGLRRPCLALILVGQDAASQIYVAAKGRACAEVGIESRSRCLPATVSEGELLHEIELLNADTSVDGILVQLPLPQPLSRWRVIKAIAPEKDVDGLSPANQGLMAWAKPGLYSCTPLGIMELIRSTQVKIEGCVAAVLGRSILVGAPTATLLGNEGATVFSLHSKSLNVPQLTRQADILVVATGQRHLVQADWVKPGAVVIDVGIHRVGSGIEGDVNFKAVAPIAGHITPVPGGVGPMTIAMLLANTVLAFNFAKEQNRKMLLADGHSADRQV